MAGGTAGETVAGTVAAQQAINCISRQSPSRRTPSCFIAIPGIADVAIAGMAIPAQPPDGMAAAGATIVIISASRVSIRRIGVTPSRWPHRPPYCMSFAARSCTVTPPAVQINPASGLDGSAYLRVPIRPAR